MDILSKCDADSIKIPWRSIEFQKESHRCPRAIMHVVEPAYSGTRWGPVRLSGKPSTPERPCLCVNTTYDEGVIRERLDALYDCIHVYKSSHKGGNT